MAAVTRRTFLASTAAFLAAPLVGEAQEARKVYRIGMLETRSTTLNAANVDAFQQGMRELGYREGQNLQIEYRSADGHDERFPGLATELLNLKVDLILTRGTPAALAAKSATRTVPVVMAASGGPVEAGIVPSLAHPGGNVTGLSSGITESYPKRVELLSELLPRLQRIAALINMGNRVVPPQWEIIQQSARSLGIEAQLLDIRRPEDLPGALEAGAKARAQALVVGLDGVTQGNLRPIAELALKHRLPSVYPARDYAQLGGLMTYGSSDFHLYHRAATFVHKIFKGAKPAELPIEQPTTYELFINRSTAKALGLTIPASVLARADQVIE
jgi:putative ABC transport system substrate-binding protein